MWLCTGREERRPRLPRARVRHLPISPPHALGIVCFSCLLPAALSSCLPSKGVLFKDLNASAPVFFFFQKAFIFTLSLAFSSLYLFSIIRELLKPRLPHPQDHFPCFRDLQVGLEVWDQSYFAVYLGVKNLKRRQLIAYKKEETGHPDTFSGEKTIGGSKQTCRRIRE